MMLIMPPIVACWMCPFRHLNMKPMSIASGMVMPMVKVPHELSASALTTARPRPASAMTTMNSTAIAPVVPATGPISVRAMSASDRPPRRTEAQSEMKSWTAPAMQTPPTIHSRPGAYPNCAASTGPISGPAPVMAAKWWPNNTHRRVG